MIDRNDISQMIEDCENRDHKLGDWESKFIDSISRQLERGKTLTTLQESTLEAIWEQVT